MSETTPGGPLYLRGIQRRAQNQQQKNSGDQASEATKEEQRRKAERKIRAWVNNCNLTTLQSSERAIALAISRCIEKNAKTEGVLEHV